VLNATRNFTSNHAKLLTNSEAYPSVYHNCFFLNKKNMLSIFSSWPTTISLIFGGCCSNAITLEQITSEHPDVGSVLTIFQFLVISLHGLPKFLIWTRFGPRFRPRRVPFATYLAQVVLFYLVSLLNNAAFAYHIPMAVHIIFRSAGLVISMVLGWLISDKRFVCVCVRTNPRKMS